MFVAKMKFGPWVRPADIKLEPFEACDATAFEGHKAWIKPGMIFTATPSAAGWRVNYGKVYDGPPITWLRKRIWCEPEDLDLVALGHRNSLELSHNQDGSGKITMTVGGETAGEITIPANQFETIAAWFAQAHRSNQL